MERLLKIGLVVDNYKIPKFKKTLIDNKYNILLEKKFTAVTTLIQFEAPREDIPKLKKLFKKINIDIKLSN